MHFKQRLDQHSIPSDKGSTLVEYALLVALIATTTVGVVASAGRGTRDQFETVAAEMAVSIPSETTSADEDSESGGAETTSTTATTTASTSSTTTTVPVTIPPVTLPPLGGGSGGGGIGGGFLPPLDLPDLSVEASSKWQNKNEWRSTFSFTNTWDEDAKLTLQIVTTAADGTTSTEIKKNFNVKDNATKSYSFNNKLKTKDAPEDQIVSVTVTVVAVETKDDSGDKFDYQTEGPSLTLNAPA